VAGGFLIAFPYSKNASCTAAVLLPALCFRLLHRKWLMLYFWLCHSTWLFCFSNTLKIYAFSPNFPLAGSVIGGFYWLFPWNFKEIKHQPFSMTQPYFFGSVIV